MAVAARSYAKRFSGQHAKEGFDFCDTTHCQVFYWRSVTERIRMAEVYDPQRRMDIHRCAESTAGWGLV